MYRLVDESESHRYRSYCARVLTETCEMLREEGINAQFVLVGSGARNLITRNGDGPYDLDYNLVIIAADPFYMNDPHQLKEKVRSCLNAAEGNYFSDAQDSTAVLTCLLHFNDTPKVEFSFDVAIVRRNKNGNLMRLILARFPCSGPRSLHLYKSQQGPNWGRAQRCPQTASCGMRGSSRISSG